MTTQPDPRSTLAALLPRLTGVWGPLGEALSRVCPELVKLANRITEQRFAIEPSREPTTVEQVMEHRLHDGCLACHGTGRVPLAFPQWGNGSFSGIVGNTLRRMQDAMLADKKGPTWTREESTWWRDQHGVCMVARDFNDDATLAALVAAVGEEKTQVPHDS